MTKLYYAPPSHKRRAEDQRSPTRQEDRRQATGMAGTADLDRPARMRRARARMRISPAPLAWRSPAGAVAYSFRPNTSLLTRVSHPGTLCRSRCRLRPGCLRSIPSCSAVRICCARFCRKGECRAWPSVTAVGSACTHTSECASRGLQRTPRSLALQEHTFTVLERACRSGAPDRAPRGERTGKHQPESLLARKIFLHLASLQPRALHPRALAIRAAQPRTVCTLRSVCRSHFRTQQTLPLGPRSRVRPTRCTRAIPGRTSVAAEPRAEPW